MTGQSRKVVRSRGSLIRSTRRAVALAVVSDGIESFPVAFTDAQALEIRVLSDYRDQIISERTRMINRLRWHLVTIAPDLEAQIGPPALKGPRICARLARQLARLPRSPRLQIAKRLLKRIAEIGREEHELLAELTALIDAHAPQLLADPGCGTVTAAIIIGHTAGAQRFPTDGHFARHAGRWIQLVVATPDDEELLCRGETGRGVVPLQPERVGVDIRRAAHRPPARLAA